MPPVAVATMLPSVQPGHEASVTVKLITIGLGSTKVKESTAAHRLASVTVTV